MPILKDDAHVLRIHEQGNTSLVAVMFGRRLGQFRMHAKGVRRWRKAGFEGGFDLLTRGEILVYPRAGEQLWVFKEWDEHARPQIGRSLLLLRAASYLAELTEILTREQSGSGAESDEADTANVKLYTLLAAAADALDKGTPPGRVLLAYTLRALALEGLLPELTVCDRCGRNLLKSRVAAWLTGQGLTCRDCLTRDAKQAVAHPAFGRGIWLQPETVQALAHVYRTSKPLALNLRNAEQMARALIVVVHGALERDLRTLLHAARMVRALGQSKLTTERTEATEKEN